jgi:hypothetical protein
MAKRLPGGTSRSSIPKKTVGRNVAAAAAVALAVGAGGLWRVRRASPPGVGTPAIASSVNQSNLDVASPFVLVPGALSGEPMHPAAGPDSSALAPPSPLDAAATEGPLMARLRRIEDSDPALAVELGCEGNRLFPNSADAPERAAIVIHALAAEGLSSEARGEAEDMVNRYPDSDRVREIEQFTGAHRHRNLRVTANGTIESY